MAYGFEAKNDSGNVIINDTIENLHFLGKATRGSASSGHGTISGYGGSNSALDGRVVHTYTITSSGTPVVFIKPTDYARWHAVIKQSVSGTTWTFEVMISGTSTSNPPEVYCFVNADDVAASSETHGMIVFKSDGSTKTFDSRRQPLAITGGANAIPPTDPTNSSGLPGTTSGHSWNYATNDHDFRSSNRYSAVSDSSINTSNTMFSCPSIAQAVYKRQMQGYKKSYGCCGCCSQEHWSTAAWWVMYRGAYRLRSGNFDAGWTGYAGGYSFSSSAESGGWFGGGGGSWSSGTMPYTAKTINLQSNAYIVADSSRYD
tara:strand:+ start:285 stop:1232 length:948 start_codon:yes stop_codon:yes gene_type:complete